MWRYEMFFSCLCMFCFLLAVLSGTCLNCAKLSIITDMGKEKPHLFYPKSRSTKDVKRLVRVGNDCLFLLESPPSGLRPTTRSRSGIDEFQM